jgi:hypothetical protein
MCIQSMLARGNENFTFLKTKSVLTTCVLKMQDSVHTLSKTKYIWLPVPKKMEVFVHTHFLNLRKSICVKFCEILNNHDIEVNLPMQTSVNYSHLVRFKKNQKLECCSLSFKM